MSNASGRERSPIDWAPKGAYRYAAAAVLKLRLEINLVAVSG